MSVLRGFILSVLVILTLDLFSQPYAIVKECGIHESGITVMTKDHNGKLLIAGDKNGYVYFHDLITCELKKKVKVHGAAVNQLRFNSTGRLLISSTNDGEIKIYDFVADKVIQAVFSPDYAGINFVLFSIADGFIYFNGNKKLFKTRSDLTQPIVPIALESDTLNDAVITSDRSSLILATGSILKIINTRTDLASQEINTGSKIRSINLINDTILATWSMDGTINYYKFSSGQINSSPVFFLKAGTPSAMGFSKDGKLMTSGNIGNWARIWKPMERTMMQELFGHVKTVTSVLFGVTDDIIYSGSLDGKILLWKKGATPLPTPTPTPSPTVPQPLAVKPATKDTLQVKTYSPAKLNPDIEMTSENIPKYIYGRKVVSNVKIAMTSPNVRVYVFDNSSIDGDTMSLFFNGSWILDHYGVTKEKQSIELNLTPNTNNYLVLFANNLGKSPPNTAAIEFNDGKTKRLFRLSSDLKSCSAINFYYKK